MTSFEIKNTLVLIVALANLLFSLFTFFKNTKSNINRSWAFVSLAVFSWTFSMFLYRISGIGMSVLSCKLLYITASLIPSAFVFFAYLFTSGKENLSSKKKALIFLPNIIIIFLTAWEDLVIKGVAFYSETEKITFFGPLYFLYFIYIATGFAWSFLIFFKKYLKSEGVMKAQLKYILVGAFSSVIFGTTCNLLFPALGIFRFEWFGPTATIIFVSFITAAVTKYRLFDVKAILTECLVMAMGIILFILPLIINPAFEMKILMFGVFLIYCFIGYLLIRSVTKEIKAKETFEQRVKERTKELQESKDELEKFYKLTIGRELRMAELKEKIKELENIKKIDQ